MSNPSINFRVSKYHLARALWVIRQFEPDYKVTSLSHIVKTCFFDYIAKMNLRRTNEVPNEIIIEIKSFMLDKTEKYQAISIEDLINMQERQQIESESETKPEESSISSVSDFSPPEDWKENQ